MLFFVLLMIAASGWWCHVEAFIHRLDHQHHHHYQTLATTTNILPPLHATASRSGKKNDKSSSSSSVEISFPTPNAAVDMGIRDWPQIYHPSSWTESVSEGAIITRYVLDGRGRVSIDYVDDSTGKSRRIDKQRVYPGTLVEVDGEATISWDVDDPKTGMIVLTPNYEEGGKLALVGGFIIVFCVGLLIGSSGGI